MKFDAWKAERDRLTAKIDKDLDEGGNGLDYHTPNLTEIIYCDEEANTIVKLIWRARIAGGGAVTTNDSSRSSVFLTSKHKPIFRIQILSIRDITTFSRDYITTYLKYPERIVSTDETRLHMYGLSVDLPLKRPVEIRVGFTPHLIQSKWLRDMAQRDLKNIRDFYLANPNFYPEDRNHPARRRDRDSLY